MQKLWRLTSFFSNSANVDFRSPMAFLFFFYPFLDCAVLGLNSSGILKYTATFTSLITAN